MGHREIIFFTLMVSVILPTNSLSSITTVSEDTPFSATNDVNSKMQSTPKIDQNATFQTVTNKTISVISTFETETVSQPNTITKITSTEAIDAPESLTSTNKEVTNNIEQTSMIEEKTILNITSPASSTGKTLQLYPTTAITISKPPTSTWLPPSFSAPEISSVVKETATAKALATVNPRQLLLTISDTQQMNVNEENNSSTIKISPMLTTVNQVQPYLTSSSSSSSSSVSKLTHFLTTNDVDLKMQATPEINPNVISQSDTNRTMSVVSTFVTKIVSQPKTKIASTETTEAQESVTSTAKEVTNNIEQTNANLNIVTSALSTVPTPYLYPTTSMTSSDPLTPTSSFSSFSSPDTKPLVKETSTALASASLSTSSPSITTKLNTETATMNTSTTFKSSTPHPTTTNNTPNPSSWSSSSSTSSSKSSTRTIVREKTTIGNSSTTVKPNRQHSTRTEKTSSQSSSPSSLSSSSPLPSLSSESSSVRWTSKILLTTLTTNQRGNELNYLNSKISDLNGDISSLQVAVAMLSILLVLILVLCLIYFIRRRKRPTKSPFAEMAADKIELKLRKNEGARPYFDITHNQFRQSTASLGENTGEAMSAETFKPPVISVHSELNGANESCDTNMENV